MCVHVHCVGRIVFLLVIIVGSNGRAGGDGEPQAQNENQSGSKKYNYIALWF